MKQVPSEYQVSFGPLRDRRRRKRIFTLKHVAIGSLLLAVLFVVATILSERYGPDPGEHGRLYRQRADKVPVVEAERIAPVVEATPLKPGGGADPLLLDAAKREQYLGVGAPIPLLTPETLPTDSDYQIVPERQNLPKLGGGVFRDATDGTVVTAPSTQPKAKRKIVISGGANGVELRVD